MKSILSYYIMCENFDCVATMVPKIQATNSSASVKGIR